MDAYDRCTNLGKKNLAGSAPIYGRGREMFRPPTYELYVCYNFPLYVLCGVPLTGAQRLFAFLQISYLYSLLLQGIKHA